MNKELYEKIIDIVKNKYKGKCPHIDNCLTIWCPIHSWHNLPLEQWGEPICLLEEINR